MKKKITLIICVLLLLTGIVYVNSWLDGTTDALEHVMKRYTVEGQAITAGEYLNSGADKEGGYIRFSVTLADGSTCLIRTDVKWRQTLTQIGPQCRVKGIRVEKKP